MPSGHKVVLEDGTEFRTCICCEFDCDQEYAKDRGVDCKGKFWEKECLFCDAHTYLNVEEKEQ